MCTITTRSAVGQGAVLDQIGELGGLFIEELEHDRESTNTLVKFPQLLGEEEVEASIDILWLCAVNLSPLDDFI